MRYGTFSRVAAAAAFVFLAIAAALPALEGVELSGGLLWTGNSRTDTGAPSPVYPAFTAAFPIRFGSSGSFLFVPSLTFFRAWYLADPESGAAVPAEIEQRDLTVLVLLPDAALRYELFSGERVSGGPEASLGFFLPVPVAAAGGTEEVSSIVSDLYGGGKFVMPAAGWYWEIPLKGMPLAVSVKAYLPLHRLWDGEGLPFYDRLGIFLKAGFRF